MSVAANPTLGDLIYRLAVRCGFAAQGGASLSQKPILRDFLQDAQQQIIVQLDQAILHRVNTTDPGHLTQGEVLYDVPSDCDPQNIDRLTVLTMDNSAVLSVLRRGIGNRRFYPVPGPPYRWEVRYGTSGQPQIEVFPEPDQDYPFVLEYQLNVQRFEEDGDQVTINPTLVFLHALFNAKAHYGQKGGDPIGRQLDTMLSKIKSFQHKGKRYFRQGFTTANQAALYQMYYEWETQAGKVIEDVDVLLSSTGEYLTP